MEVPFKGLYQSLIIWDLHPGSVSFFVSALHILVRCHSSLVVLFFMFVLAYLCLFCSSYTHLKLILYHYLNLSAGKASPEQPFGFPEPCSWIKYNIYNKIIKKFLKVLFRIWQRGKILDSIAVSLFGWSKQIQYKSSPNRDSIQYQTTRSK